MWAALRGRALGVKFRRQSVIGPFIADFTCFEHRLIVEVDGAVHEGQREHDAERQTIIEAHGYTFFRVTSEEVERDLEAVLVRLRAVLASRKPEFHE
jgi:very-short-patch-repair endonuclease